MENKYILRLDSENNIVWRAYTFDYAADDIELSREEYETSCLHLKFNPETREFSDPIELPEEIEIVNEHEEITKEVYQTTSLSADDNLINMDLLVAIDDKLNLILDHLGLNV